MGETIKMENKQRSKMLHFLCDRLGLHVFLMSVWVSTVQRHAALVTELSVCLNVNGCLSILYVSVL